MSSLPNHSLFSVLLALAHLDFYETILSTENLKPPLSLSRKGASLCATQSKETGTATLHRGLCPHGRIIKVLEMGGPSKLMNEMNRLIGKKIAVNITLNGQI